jgi:hypothetical protein
VITDSPRRPVARSIFSLSEHPLDRTKSPRKEATCPLPPPRPVGIETFPWRWRPAPCPEEPLRRLPYVPLLHPSVPRLHPSVPLLNPSVPLLLPSRSRPARSVGVRPRLPRSVELLRREEGSEAGGRCCTLSRSPTPPLSPPWRASPPPGSPRPPPRGRSII